MFLINKYLIHDIKKVKILLLNASKFSTEAEILTMFDQKTPPKYTKTIPERPEVIQKPKQKKQLDVLIECKRPEFNHHKNQTYDKLKPIPLASKGWNHYKSKGDYFKIHIFKKDANLNKLYWDSNKSFEDLNIDQNIINALQMIGITKPTIIQEQSIPKILSGNNALLTAETGCGKTLAYLIPIVQQILRWNQNLRERPPNTPLALILCPNRELVFQIGEIAKKLSHQLPFRCEMLVGGRTKKIMMNPDFKNVDLQIATIGVLSKLTTVGLFNVQDVRHLVLDEADTMLDDSFNELLIHFLKKLNITYKRSSESEKTRCQLTLVSATKPTSLYSILEDFVETDSLIKLTTPRLHQVMPHVPQTFFRIAQTEKPGKLLSLAKRAVKENKPTIIFSNKASACDWISMFLSENNVPTLNLNGEMPLVVRMGKYKEFQEGKCTILSCTDIASRGLDTKQVGQVINYDFPMYMADYIHRCGRTGRCGSPQDCSIVHFVSGEREIDLVNKIEIAVRTNDALPNVNANITKIIRHKINKNHGTT